MKSCRAFPLYSAYRYVLTEGESGSASPLGIRASSAWSRPTEILLPPSMSNHVNQEVWVTSQSNSQKISCDSISRICQLLIEKSTLFCCTELSLTEFSWHSLPKQILQYESFSRSYICILRFSSYRTFPAQAGQPGVRQCLPSPAFGSEVASDLQRYIEGGLTRHND